MADASETPNSGTALSATGKLGLALGLANLLLARQAERRHPPIGEILTLGKARVHALRQGEGPPIVLIHGNGSLMQDFQVAGLVDRLARRHEVILFDRPGFGHSNRPSGTDWTPEAQASLLARAADQLGIRNPIVVGHSFGALVAMAWALDRPSDVAALGLISGYYYPTLRPDARLQALLSLPLVDRALAWTLLPFQARLSAPLAARLLFAPADPTPAFEQHMPKSLLSRPQQVRASAHDGAQLPAAAERLHRRIHALHLPTLVAWGAGDRMVWPRGQADRLAEELPHVDTLMVEGAGHMLHHSAPAAVAEAIERLADEGAQHQRQLPALAPREIEGHGAVPLRGIR